MRPIARRLAPVKVLRSVNVLLTSVVAVTAFLRQEYIRKVFPCKTGPSQDIETLDWLKITACSFQCHWGNYEKPTEAFFRELLNIVNKLNLCVKQAFFNDNAVSLRSRRDATRMRRYIYDRHIEATGTVVFGMVS